MAALAPAPLIPLGAFLAPAPLLSLQAFRLCLLVHDPGLLVQLGLAHLSINTVGIVQHSVADPGNFGTMDGET